MANSVAPRLPAPRGPLSAFLVEHLVRPPHNLAHDAPLAGPGEDASLALYLLYELHYRGFADVDPDWEWEPSAIAVRSRLEQNLLDRIVAGVGPPPPAVDAITALRLVLADDDGPSLSRWVLTHGHVQHLREFAVHRSAYQRKEADPHTWAIPRLDGRAKAALVRIQADEYGGGAVAEVHAQLFADTMAALGVDPTYGAHLDRIPGVTLDTVNLVTMFGLHRRWRGALVGHLAAFEMTSVEPMSRYATALRRVGLGDDAARFYDVHVEADAVHEVIAADELVGGLLDDEPELAGDVLFGARALLHVERRFAEHLLRAWRAGRSSLLQASVPPPAEVDAA